MRQFSKEINNQIMSQISEEADRCEKGDLSKISDSDKLEYISNQIIHICEELRRYNLDERGFNEVVDDIFETIAYHGFKKSDIEAVLNNKETI